MSKLGRKILSFIDILSRSDVREVLSVMQLDGSDVYVTLADQC